jgi:BNR repeat-like domain/Divergent InlB B-repeat domain
MRRNELPMASTFRRLAARATPWAVLLVAALFALPSASALGNHGLAPVGSPHAALAVPMHPHALAPTAPRVASAPLGGHSPSAGPVASARGTFFTTNAIPTPPVGSTPCYTNYFASKTCANITNDPSINYTSNGVLAVAYTAYTNISQCANVTNYTVTQVGFSASTNGGSSWSTPIYLGNPDCTVAGNYPNAWTPSLTSLANGTLVLAYIEFNVTKFVQIPGSLAYGGWGPYSWAVPFDRLVVTESYDNGVAWTRPHVLNSSNNPGLNASAFAPLRPWVTAIGKTIYVTWMNDSKDEYYSTSASAAVHLIVSKDGGATWGAQKDLTSFGSSGLEFSSNPSLTTGASGELYVTYSTNVSYDSLHGIYYTDIEVARSANNGTTFSYSVAVGHTGFVVYRDPFHDPSPQLAYGSATGQLLLSFGGYQIITTCYSYGCYPSEYQSAFVANSSDGGVTWSAAHVVAPQLSDFTKYSQMYNPSVVVGPTGTVYVEMSYVNSSLCAPYIYGSACGEQSQVFAWSNDNGSTFSSAFQISNNQTVLPYYPDGEYDTLVVVGSQVYIAWTIDLCINAVLAYCNWPGYTGDGVAQVQVSSLFQGTGWDLNFTETGLAAGTGWSVNVQGNVRSGFAPTPLQVTGVPDGSNVSWNLSSPAGGYGVRYFGAATITPPAVITANTTVTETFSEQVLVNVTSSPFIPGSSPFGTYCGLLIWDNPYCPMINYNITPRPGPNWVSVGTSMVLNVTNQSQWCPPGFCYFQELNLSFESWTGNGAGSTNTSSNLTTVVARGPINETANFALSGWCFVEKDPPYFSYDTCWKQNASLAFHESGLPRGQNWTVTVQGSGAVTTVTSNSSWIYISGVATSRVAYYYVWSIPAGAGEYWIGTGTPVSPVELPVDSIVSVNFVRELPSAAVFPLFVNQTGLLTGPWSFSVAGTGFGVAGNGTSLALAGGSYGLNASPVFLQNGTAFYANVLSTQPLVVNSTGLNYSTPATVPIDGPTLAEFVYTPAYYCTVASGVGGTANVTSQWIQQGRSLHLNATAAPGYSFVGWTGFGIGAVNSSRNAITITPGGPVSEFAAFVHLPASTWTVTVQETGLPATLAYTLGLGPQAYTGNGTFSVSGLATGNYSLSVGYVYLNSSDLTRYLPTVSSSSFTRNAGGALEITQNGFVNVTFAAQYLLTLAATGNGTISPAPGTYWQDPSTAVAVVATPAPHYMFAGWNGSGTGAMNTNARAISLTLGGPVWETAQFLWAPIPPVTTFSLAVQQTGLPASVSWVASVGVTGAHGPGAGLTITGLNGSYTLQVPPVYVGTDTRYVANVTTVTAVVAVPVTQNASVSVVFTEQFLLTVVGGSGGTITPGTNGWVNSGTTLTLNAQSNATSSFVGWTGTGTGSYTGTLASQSITVQGPITETATFAAVYPVKSSGSSTAGAPLALGLLILLVVVGLVVGYVLFRRRPPREVVVEAPPVEGESTEEYAGPP